MARLTRRQAVRQAAGAIAGAAIAMPAVSRLAVAQVTSIRLGKQYGLPFLPQMVMEKLGLIEKHAAAAGLPGIKTEWITMSGPGPLNDALLSGGIEFVNVAPPALITLWEKSAATPRPVKALCAVQSMPYILVTRNPDVKSIADFTAKDKIAVPTVKISGQAMMIQMAAAKLWGPDQFERIDPFTISMAHPDATTAMLSGRSEVTGHFCVAPFQYYELAAPGMHSVLKSYDTIGGPHTNGVQVTTEKFFKDNPKLCAATFAAHTEANAFIKANPAQAAEIYLELSKDKRSPAGEIVKMISDPDIDYTTTPASLEKLAQFMKTTNRIKSLPASWKDLFLPEAHALKGT